MKGSYSDWAIGRCSSEVEWIGEHEVRVEMFRAARTLFQSL